MIKGSCHCGGVHFAAEAEPRPVILCHCSDCKKTIGNSMPATAVPKDDLRIIETTLKWYKSSDTARRGFCGNCGCSLFWDPYDLPHTSISADTIDNFTYEVESEWYNES